MKKLLYTLIALFIFVISFAQVGLASGPYGYQPKLPQKFANKDE